MKPLARPQFICSAIEKCTEKVDCCVHKTPHIKDERCVPKACRYAPGIENVDCDPYDPANPRVPIPVPVITKTVEQVMKEKITATRAHIAQQEAALKALEEEPVKYVPGPAVIAAEPIRPEPVGAPIEEVTLVLENEATQEIDIKEAVKKQVQKKGGRKKA